MAVDGILSLNKPPGKTSFQVTARLKKLSGVRRVGHCGTLDPEATGVLPVCFGQGTRAVEFLQDGAKIYRFQMELGATTDTYDASGKVLEKKDPSFVTREDVEEKLSLFRGSIRQLPPMFSALHYQGTRLYHLARRGIEVERRARPALVHRFELLEWHPPVTTLEVECGKGTYIRSLVHDLGQALGCGAFLRSLVRLRVGPFTLDSALSLPEVERAFQEGYWQSLLYPIDIAFGKLFIAIVNQEEEKLLRNGRLLPVESVELLPAAAGHDKTTGAEELPGLTDLCRAYSRGGQFLAVLRFDPERGLWHPQKVFSSC